MSVNFCVCVSVVCFYLTNLKGPAFLLMLKSYVDVFSINSSPYSFY